MYYMDSILYNPPALDAFHSFKAEEFYFWGVGVQRGRRVICAC